MIKARIAVALLVLAALAGCTPQAGDSCDPKKDSSFLSSHTENGKTTTTKLECKQVGIDKYEWRKV
jgi:hypothetical protein